MVDAHNNGDHGYKMALMDHSTGHRRSLNRRGWGTSHSHTMIKWHQSLLWVLLAPTLWTTGIMDCDWSQESGTVWKLLGILCHWMYGAWMRKTGQLVPFSEQQLVDCSSAGSCQGGMMGPAWEYAQRKGLESESAYPYYGQDMSCRYNAGQVVAYAAGWHRVSANEQSLKMPCTRLVIQSPSLSMSAPASNITLTVSSVTHPVSMDSWTMLYYWLDTIRTRGDSNIGS